MSQAWELLIMGFSVSWGPCFLLCAPLIFSYLAADERGWKRTIPKLLIFASTRLVTFAILGSLAAIIGKSLAGSLRRYDEVLFILAGFFVCLLGLLIILGKSPQPRLCGIMRRFTIDNPLGGAMILGFLLGILPCFPHLVALTYISLISKGLGQGTLYGLSFGMGTLLSPAIILGGLGGSLPSLIKNRRYYQYLQWGCGLLLLFLGIRIAWRG